MSPYHSPESLPWAGQPYSIKRHGVTVQNCDSEPVQTPGCIQGHGALLALRPTDLTVLQASENTDRILGRSAGSLIGLPVSDLIGAPAEAAVRATLANESTERSPHFVFTHPAPAGALDATVHTAGGVAVIEFEATGRSAGAEPDYVAAIKKALTLFQSAPTLKAFGDLVAEEVRRLTKFDRVMVYRFHSDGNGEVLAESRRADLTAWLGLHFPASDFPRPAREVFRKLWVRPISDVSEPLAEMVPLTNPHGGGPLDMTACALRGVSLMHTEYLRNMGVTATLTMPIRSGPDVWGLIACHHYTGPHHVSARCRDACAFLAQVVSLQHTAVGEWEYLGYRLAIDRAHEHLIACAVAVESLSPLTEGSPNLLDGISSDGAAVFHQGRWWRVGDTPTERELDELDDWLSGREELESLTHPLFATDCLPHEYPPAAGFSRVASGVLVVPLSRAGLRNRMYWFRSERVRTVEWAGNPYEKPTVVGPHGPRLTPRASFELFKESVRGRSAPWLAAEMAAAAQFRLMVMELLASGAARLAEENAELNRSIRERERAENRLRTQYAVGCALDSSASLAEAAQKLLRPICEFNGWDLGVFWEPTRGGHELTCLGVWHRAGPDLAALAQEVRATLPARGRGLPGVVWATGRAYWSRPASEDTPHVRGKLAVPFRLGVEVLGLVELMRRAECEPDPEMVRLLDTVGGQVALFVQRKRAEEQLIASHRENNRLLDAISSILISVDLAGRVTRWNDTAAAVFGATADQVVGRALEACPFRWARDGDRERFLQGCRGSTEHKLEDLLLAANGRERVLSLTAYPITERNEHCGCLVLGQDVTERKMLEEELRRAHKLESVGQLAAGIAHEINTPIQYIGDNTGFIGDALRDLSRVIVAYRSAGDDPGARALADAAAADADLDYLLTEAPRALGQTLEGIRHVARIVKAMKEFAHPGAVEKVPLDLNRALETVITVARNEWKYVAEVETRLAPDLPPVHGLPGELNQVFLNLLVNAAHAVKDAHGGSGRKGLVTVSTRAVGNVVEVRISDTGCGIPEGIRNRVFDPFFTTKPVGQGTGQGLSIAHAVVVKQHGGAVTFETEAGKGTTFIVQLPRDGTRLTSAELLGTRDGGRSPSASGGGT
ncbi:GAF domain-containing protein [Gemmata sp. JC717]|uniref:ATP-binding protein n=1 Tax=Gemmata algarum TaxID=2975278 RepID=UPI0021BAEB02|nr:ATP-binding protein [Gemmata algarum]MDY3552962.1 GAF domain-containing protein [Gemmata algarum]